MSASAPDPRKHARKKAVAEQAAKPESEKAIVVVVNGVRYSLDPDEMNALDVADLRLATGMSFGRLMETLGEDPDIDIIAAVVWLARRQHGEPKIKYRLVVQEINYLTELDFSENDPDAESNEPAEDNSPEA